MADTMQTTPPRARLEHVNLTVRDARASAAWLGKVFGWTTRWEGRGSHSDGLSLHVGAPDEGSDYVALWQPDAPEEGGRANHVGVVVGDLDAVEAAVRATGRTPHHHADYAPGRRFYVFDAEGIEWEVVSYADR
ncbi:MAG: VOC family protein [Shimia sp.]